MSERKMDITVDNTPKIVTTKSFYEKLNEQMNKSPATVITSICALFIVLILSLTLPLYFPQQNKHNSS